LLKALAPVSFSLYPFHFVFTLGLLRKISLIYCTKPGLTGKRPIGL
jgi:hypothetical protein